MPAAVGAQFSICAASLDGGALPIGDTEQLTSAMPRVYGNSHRRSSFRSRLLCLSFFLSSGTNQRITSKHTKKRKRPSRNYHQTLVQRHTTYQQWPTQQAPEAALRLRFRLRALVLRPRRPTATTQARLEHLLAEWIALRMSFPRSLPKQASPREATEPRTAHRMA
jgi:hypothetical protein